MTTTKLSPLYEALHRKAEQERELRKGERAADLADEADGATRAASAQTARTGITIDARIQAEHLASSAHAVAARLYRELGLPDAEARHLASRGEHIARIVALRAKKAKGTLR